MANWRLKMKLRQYSTCAMHRSVTGSCGCVPAWRTSVPAGMSSSRSFADSLWTEPIRRLQRRHIVHGQEGVVVFPEADVGPLQLLLDEGVAVEPVGGMEREEAGHAQDDRTQNFIPDVEIVVGETAVLVRQDAVMGIAGGIPRD